VLRWILAALTATLVITVSFFGEMLLSGSGFGFGGSRIYSGRFWVTGIATIIGVVSSIVVSALRQLPQDQRVSVPALADYMLRPNSFVALCISPVVFYGVLVAAGEQQTDTLSWLAAFQNGFFWEQVLKAQGAQVGISRKPSGKRKSNSTFA
jgi:hypothetical protein